MLALLGDWFLGPFIPHGHCYLWKPGLVWLHVVSDSLIALSYYSIPLTLVYFVHKRRDLPFDWIFLLFGSFIVACGTTHLLAIWTLWHPDYWISGFVKAITAAVSLCTAVLLVDLIPKALALSSPAQLEAANRQLAREIGERRAAETELQRALQQLRFHVENTPLAVMELNSEFRVQRWSQQAVNIFGWQPQEVLNQRLDDWQFVFEEDLPGVQQDMGCLLNGSKPYIVGKNRNYTKDGSVIYCEWYNSALWNQSGELVSILSLALDVTERTRAEDALKQAKEELEVRVEERTAQLQQVNEHLVIEIQERRVVEAALRKSEKRLNLALSAAQMGAWDWDILSDRINWSDGVEALFGLKPGDFAGTYDAFLNCLHPEDLPTVTQALSRAVETGTSYEVETRIIGVDGTIHWIASIGAVFHDSNGAARCLTGTVMDITKRKQVELALERERQQLRQIITCAPVAMAMFDTQMRCLAHSQKWLTVQGLEGQSIIGRSHYELFPDFPEYWKDKHQRGLQGEIFSVSEDVWERADGSKVYLRWAIHPWYIPDGKIGGIVVVTDQINELVEAREAALEAAQLKSEFLANMSHEIRTPMNGVLGMAGLLLQTPLIPQQLDYARTIRNSAEHLLDVINDILDFSKLEVGEMPLEQLDFDLDNCIESVIDVLATQAESKALELAVLINSDVPRQLQGDPKRLRQILLNLVSNAIKFTDIGEVVVKVAVVEQKKAEDRRQRVEGIDPDASSTSHLATRREQQNLLPSASWLEPSPVLIRFEIIDTGIGISAADCPKLFKPFSQVDASTTRQYGGTGLGLVICKQLVELMGGEIGVESVLGQGSTFWFTVPFGTQVMLEATVCPLVLSQLKLLVVADKATTRQAVRSLVESWGVLSCEAGDITATLDALHSSAAQGHPCEVAIIDLQMPDNQGEQLVSMIRRDPTLAQTKLIVMTSLHQRDAAKALESIDISGYIIKPVRASRLFDSLIRVCGKQTSSTLTTQAGSEGMSGSGEQAKTKNSNPYQSQLKILLVEDHPVNQMVILNQLQMLGYEADCVDNGKEAIAFLETQNYDIVLMDCQMPVLDGYEATQELRRREGKHRHTIVIALTAHALPADRDKCLAAGMDDYLSKPVDQQALGAIIERWAKHIPTSQTIDTSEPSALNHDETPLDLERLNNISRGKVAFQQRLVQSFVKNAQPGLEQMRLAIQEKNFITLEQQAHRIKGASANVGVRVMPEVAGQLERQAREKTLEGATERLDILERQLEQVKVFLEKW